MHLSIRTASDIIHNLLKALPDGLAGVVDVDGLDVLAGFMPGKFRL